MSLFALLADIGFGVLAINALAAVFLVGVYVGYEGLKRDQKEARDQARAEGYCEGLARGTELARGTQPRMSLGRRAVLDLIRRN